MSESAAPDAPISHDEVRRLTWALLQPDTAVAAAEALAGRREGSAVEGLVELLLAAPPARPALAAVAALEGHDGLLVRDALVRSLASPHPSVRLAAVEALRRRDAGCAADLLRVLGRDGSWLVRRAALQSLAGRADEGGWLILAAADDPHWRVRHALVRVLLSWGESDDLRREIDARLAARGDPRSEGVRLYLDWRWSGRPPERFPAPAVPDPTFCPFWDWDPAVLARSVEQFDRKERREAAEVMPFLLGHPEERVRTPAAEVLRSCGAARQLAEAIALLDDPRRGAGESLEKLLGSLNLDQTEDASRFILGMTRPTPGQLAWALDQAGTAFPFEEEQERLTALLAARHDAASVRRALARLAARWPRPESEGTLAELLSDADGEVQAEALRGLVQIRSEVHTEATLTELLRSPHASARTEAVKAAVARGLGRSELEPLANDPEVRVRLALAQALAGLSGADGDALLTRLRADVHAHVRAAALTPEAAAVLVREPERETSWHVLARAARLTKTPLWRLEPLPPWRPDERPAATVSPLTPRQPPPVHERRLGPEGLAVSPLGVSGHYGLPVDGFVRAIEAGVNLLFWEPNYQTLTEFMSRLSPAGRGGLHVVAGTFEADGRRVRSDAERVLRMLRVERVALFLLFWTRSWRRVTPELTETLERLKREGKVGMFSLSTHSRPLALEAMDRGWDPVMVRHSAAHRGAEQEVFPKAALTGTSVITFNNTCYGRLLKPLGDSPPPTAADCYRYCLAQPAVRACLSAPATVEQLEENLKALHDPELPEDRLRALLAHGAALYREETVFRRLVREF